MFDLGWWHQHIIVEKARASARPGTKVHASDFNPGSVTSTCRE